MMASTPAALQVAVFHSASDCLPDPRGEDRTGEEMEAEEPGAPPKTYSQPQ